MSKLKELAVENYSKAYARKVVTEFFAAHELMQGKQILTFTEVNQVNMFVLQYLFTTWQEETAKLQSPYFDYQAYEVKEALGQFMNTVSKHIAIRREHVEPLVNYAVKSTLVLLLAPQEFFAQLIRKEGFTINIAQLKEAAKYIQINKAIFNSFLRRLASVADTELPVNQALTVLEEVCQARKDEIEQPDDYLDTFSRKIPVYKEDLLDTPAPVAEKPVAPVVNNFAVDIEQFVKAVNNSPVNTPPANIPAEPVKPASDQVKAASLHEKFMREQVTLNDRLKQEPKPTLLDKHQKTRIQDIKSAISLNQRFLFINSLFKGDNTAFNQALQEIDQCPDYQAASSLLKEKYAAKYGWDMKSEEVDSFVEVIERKFY
jgi:hypothetical protein